MRSLPSLPLRGDTPQSSPASPLPSLSEQDKHNNEPVHISVQFQACLTLNLANHDFGEIAHLYGQTRSLGQNDSLQLRSGTLN